MQENGRTPPLPAEHHAGIALRPPLDGSLSFVSREARTEATAELVARGALLVEVSSPPASVRGRLTDYLDEQIERELGIRGAKPSYDTPWSATQGSTVQRLRDQLDRARAVGSTGIALSVGTLAQLAAPSLTPEDSATVRSLATSSETNPLAVLLDEGDLRLNGYFDSRALSTLLPSVDIQRVQGTERTLVPPYETETVVDAKVAEKGEHRATIAASPLDAARVRATVGIPARSQSDMWRSWVVQLEAARGPQPLSAFERLFVSSYMPLETALAEGLKDPRAMRTHDAFRAAFEHMYTDAFATFGATGRRPRLVMDAFDVATNHARLHHARTTHVLVVDAMRYDLGVIVRDQIALHARAGVALTSESLLWSALPSTTFRQLETLARGMDALRAPLGDEDSDSLRGRSTDTVRRMRVGSRELYTLDAVPAMLAALPAPSASGAAHVVEALREIGENVAVTLLRHLTTLAPRTLLLVLGDHGFTVDKRGNVTHGGATPEEVLVPCFAYFVGELH